MSTMTNGEYEALQAILRAGGVVESCMGRMTASKWAPVPQIRTLVLNALARKGYIRHAATPSKPLWCHSKVTYRLEVSASGCEAVHDERGRRSLLEDAKRDRKSGRIGMAAS